MQLRFINLSALPAVVNEKAKGSSLINKYTNISLGPNQKADAALGPSNVIPMKLTKNIAELVGFWKMRQTRAGVGIIGNFDLQEKFVKLVLSAKLVPPDKIVTSPHAIWFSNIKIRNFFQKTVRDQGEIFSRRNPISAAYLRGIYESAGEGQTISEASFQDQLLIERLGFTTKKGGKTIYIRDIENFKNFIKK